MRGGEAGEVVGGTRSLLLGYVFVQDFLDEGIVGRLAVIDGDLSCESEMREVEGQEEEEGKGVEGSS